MSLLQAGFGSSAGDYTIDDSLRFRASATAYLSRTPASATNQKTWTWSGWVKRSNIAANGQLFTARTAVSATYFGISFQSSGDLRIECNLETAYPLYKTNALFRDPSAWYHIVVALDMTQATSTNRLKVYINGVLQTTASYNVPAQNTDLNVNSTATHLIGQQASGNYLDGYLTEVNFIDGQALDPTDFGEYDDNGTWKPLAYTGTYGTNGFYLNGVGVTDESGNGNDWTNNNLNLSTSTATTYDQMKDTPSLVDENAGNFAVINPLVGPSSDTISEGNLKIATSLSYAAFSHTRATIGVSSGKWYWEVEWDATSADTGSACIGITTAVLNPYSQCIGQGAATVAYGYRNDAYKFSGGSTISYGVSYTVGDVIGVALDLDAGTLAFYKNGSDQGTAYSSITGTYFPGISDVNNDAGRNSTFIANFGQRPFAYTPPSGFLKLNTFNLPDSTIEKGSDYFNTVLYTGNGSTQSITGVGFQPDWTWIKNRDAADAHVLTDAVRGATEELQSNATSAETTNADGLTAFDTDGFSLGADVLYNTSSEAYVAWNWLASNTTASNTEGSITSTVSANTTSGFSIVSYTGTGANATVGHGLGVAPSMMIVKGRDSAGSWAVYHANANASPASGRLYLQLTNAFTAQATAWNSTVPSSTVFSVGSLTDTNQNTNAMIAYCFAEVPGYSAIGSYTGNGLADGAFVYTGMRPSFLLWKRTNSTGNWTMMDSTRNTYNVLGERLYANLSNAGSDGTIIDFVSNGFKLRVNANDQNGSGSTYIYLAFAENPFKNSNAR
jgi:hypothetical protein